METPRRLSFHPRPVGQSRRPRATTRVTCSTVRAGRPSYHRAVAEKRSAVDGAGLDPDRRGCRRPLSVMADLTV